MNKKVLIAALIATVVAFFGGWLVFGILLEGFYSENTIVYEGLWKDMENDPSTLLGILISNVAMSLLLALILDRFGNVTTFAKGFVNGLWIGFLIAVMMDASFWAFMNLHTNTMYAVDIIVNTLFYGVLGGVIGAVLGWGNKG